MSTKDKLIERFKQQPKDFTWKPHPSKKIKEYSMKQILDYLIEKKLINK